MKPDASLDMLVSRFLDGHIDQSDVDRLEAFLANDAEARRQFRREANLDVALREWAAVAGSRAAWSDADGAVSSGAAPGHVSWQLFSAVLGLGLLIGMASSTFIFAASVSQPAVGRIVPLVDLAWGWDSLPRQDGIPGEVAVWSGDFSRLVEGDQGVRPPGNRPMLRMLQSTNSQSPPGGQPSNSGELWRFVDLGPVRQRLGQHPRRIEFSALFNSAAASEGKHYQFLISIHAFTGLTSGEVARFWKKPEMDDASIASAVGRQAADMDSETWQKVAVQVVIPPEATLLLLHTAIGSIPLSIGQSPPVDFPGQYLADVSLRLLPEAADDGR